MIIPSDLKKWLKMRIPGCIYSSAILLYIEALEEDIGSKIGEIVKLEAAQPKWISVEDELPEECVEVLVYFDGVIACSEIIMFDMITKEPMWSYTGAGGDPTHWMPLPEPPKEE